MSHSTQLLGISNAIVDILAHVDEAFIEDIGAVRGAMNLIDEERAHFIYDKMGPATEMSGGSVANSVAGFANLGGEAAYIGHVRDDQLGAIFNHDMRSLGVDIRLEPAPEGAPTARSYVLITPDAQRTMNTYLGSCTELGTAHVTEATVAAPKVILIEGYVWDIAEGPELAKNAMNIAQQNGSAVALSLSDSLCVDRHRESFLAAVRNDVQIVVADEDEVIALVEADSYEDTLDKIRDFDVLWAITRSEKGSVIVKGDQQIVQAATPVDEVVDTTGAGDAYCAGFLYGWANDWSLEGMCATRHALRNARYPACRCAHRTEPARKFLVVLAFHVAGRLAKVVDALDDLLHPGQVLRQAFLVVTLGDELAEYFELDAAADVRVIDHPVAIAAAQHRAAERINLGIFPDWFFRLVHRWHVQL